MLKSKSVRAPTLDRLVRQAMCRAERLDGALVVIYTRKQLRDMVRRAGAECARIAELEAAKGNALARTRIEVERRDAFVKAARNIRREFRIEEAES